MRAALYGPQAVFPSGLKSRGGMVRVAKAAYEEWLAADRLALLQGWARDGLTDEQIVHNMGIAASTLYQWKKRHPEIAEALKRGKEVVDYEVENALLQKALGGDTTAMIFWLKNRRPDRWRDRPEAAEKGEGVRILDNY